jgi:uncharacterized protein with PQ loop repeat
MSLSISLLGTAGVLAIELSYVPQIVRLFRMKSAEEVSYLFPGLNLLGRLLALTYSLIVSNPVFTFGFFVGATMRLLLLLQVAWYRRVFRTRTRRYHAT